MTRGWAKNTFMDTEMNRLSKNMQLRRDWLILG